MNVPPPLVSFSELDDFLKALGEAASTAQSQRLLALHKKRLPPVDSATTLAVLFGYSPRFIHSMRIRPQRYYRSFSIRTGSKARQIQAPRVAIKVIQTWFGHYLARGIEWHHCVHGFVPERSTISAASAHCKADSVLSLDIREFFPSVSRVAVKQALTKIGYHGHAVNVIADLTTLNGKLPQGAPTSPVLANLVFEPIDSLLSELASKRGLVYTRYADDITLSGDSSEVKAAQKEFEAVITRNDYSIAAEKTQYFGPRDRKSVLGLIVTGRASRLPKKYRNRVRLYRHLLATEELDEFTKLRLRGHISYADSVEKQS